MDKLKSFPFFLITMFYAGYLGYQYYQFQYAPDGLFEQHQTKLKQNKDEIVGLRKKLAEGERFLKTLEVKKAELILKSKKFTDYQGALTESLDVASLLKILVTETKRLNMKIDRVDPGTKTAKEYYSEQEFRLDIKGTYTQMVLFAHRVSQLQRILRIERLTLRPSIVIIPKANASILDAQLSVMAYQYTASSEDGLAGSIK